MFGRLSILNAFQLMMIFSTYEGLLGHNPTVSQSRSVLSFLGKMVQHVKVCRGEKSLTLLYQSFCSKTRKTISHKAHCEGKRTIC